MNKYGCIAQVGKTLFFFLVNLINLTIWIKGSQNLINGYILYRMFMLLDEHWIRMGMFVRSLSKPSSPNYKQPIISILVIIMIKETKLDCWRRYAKKNIIDLPCRFGFCRAWGLSKITCSDLCSSKRVFACAWVSDYGGVGAAATAKEDC